MDLKEYLSRIGVHKICKPSLEFLSELQEGHLYSIPFEDLDIPNRGEIILDLERIYSKIIPTKRGGFCYELNGLFHWLLTNLGFNVDMLSARVYNHQKLELGPEFDHMTLLVHLVKDYVVDVGFGDSFRHPIEMPGGEAKDISGHYRIIDKAGGFFELQRFETAEWKLQYSFTTISRKYCDFEEMCYFQQNDPSSHFRTGMLCTIATPNGRMTLGNNSLTITENGNKIKTEFDSEKEFLRLLTKHFGIELL